MELLLVRHGESAWNAEGRWTGQRNPDLSARGAEQALAAARDALAGLDLRAVSSSPLRRARRTAEIIAAELELPLSSPIANLQERFAGEWSGLTSPQIEQRYPGMLQAYRAGDSVEIPAGEPWDVFQERVVRGVWEALRALERGLLVVAHAGVLRAVEEHLGEPPTRWLNLGGRWIGAHASALRAGPAHPVGELHG